MRLLIIGKDEYGSYNFIKYKHNIDELSVNKFGMFPFRYGILSESELAHTIITEHYIVDNKDFFIENGIVQFRDKNLMSEDTVFYLNSISDELVDIDLFIDQNFMVHRWSTGTLAQYIVNDDNPCFANVDIKFSKSLDERVLYYLQIDTKYSTRYVNGPIDFSIESDIVVSKISK